MLGLLVRQRVRLAWNRLARGSHRARGVAAAFAAAVFSVGFFVVAGFNAGTLVERMVRIDPGIATSTLPALLVGATLLTLVTSLGSAFHHLFLAPDLEVLMAAPVSVRSLLWLKVLEIWRDSLHVLLFQAAALFGYGQALHLPPAYFAGALVVGLLLTLAASTLGATVTLALSRVRFAGPILGLSRLLAVILIAPLGALGVPALMSGRNRASPLLGEGSVQTAATSLREIGPPPTWAPTTWAAHVLLGDEAAGLSLVLLVTAGILVYAATQLAFEGLFQGGWERARYSASTPRSMPTRFGRRTAAPVPAGPILGLVQKDWLTLVRDPRWRASAAVSVVALGVPAVLLFAGDPFSRSASAIRFWFGMVPVPYLAYLLGSQQGASTLAYEGRNIALLRASPIGVGRILVAKILGGFVLVLGVTWAATLGLAVTHGGDLIEIGEALLAATWLAGGATVAAVAGAALTVDFEGDNPQRRVGCLGTILTAALSMFFFASNAGLLAWWLTRMLMSVPGPLTGFIPIVDFSLLGLALASVGVLVQATRLGMRRLAGWESS